MFLNKKEKKKRKLNLTHAIEISLDIPFSKIYKLICVGHILYRTLTHTQIPARINETHLQRRKSTNNSGWYVTIGVGWKP